VDFVPYLTTFIAVTCLDLIWVQYMAASHEGKPGAAGVWASILFLSGSLTTLSYIHERRVIVAGCLGAFLGTYIAVRRKRRRHDHSCDQHDR